MSLAPDPPGYTIEEEDGLFVVYSLIESKKLSAHKTREGAWWAAVGDDSMETLPEHVTIPGQENIG